MILKIRPAAHVKKEEAFSAFTLTLRAGFLANATSHPSLFFLILCLTNPLVYFHLVSFPPFEKSKETFSLSDGQSYLNGKRRIYANFELSPISSIGF